MTTATAPTQAVLTAGARYEWWRADRGLNFSLSPALSVAQPEQSRHGFSPKASLRWAVSGPWSVTLSAGQAYRFPTVQELYQAISTGPTLTVPDPDLRPERARSAELAIEHKDEHGKVRLSLFGERVRDALVSQTAPLVPGSTTLLTSASRYTQAVPVSSTLLYSQARTTAGAAASGNVQRTLMVSPGAHATLSRLPAPSAKPQSRSGPIWPRAQADVMSPPRVIWTVLSPRLFWSQPSTKSRRPSP